MNSDEIITKLLKQQNIKQNANVVEIYLGNNGLTSVESLERFRMLQRVWLNSNKLRNLFTEITQLPFLKDNFRITELHLQCNEICSIRGVLSHLRYLQVLMLQKNQLDNLNEVLQELLPLQALCVLNLFDNPLAQEPGYRLLIVHLLPSVQLLDRQEVTEADRKVAREVHDAEREAIKASIAFGRRADVNPALFHQMQTLPEHQTPVSLKNNLNFNRINRHRVAERRSVMQYTTFDWSRIPDCQQRRLGESVPPPQNLTVRFR